MPSDTPAPTASPTAAVPQATIKMRAFCRYGPGKAYLYSHELKEGDNVQIDGRNGSTSWYWVQPQNLDRHCWASASVMEVTGDPASAPIVGTRLPMANNLYGPPQNVQAVRRGDEVIISWSPVWMTEDDNRGYLIEASVCQDGGRRFVAIQTFETSVSITDTAGCGGSSSGKLYTVEKHGYVDPVDIPWP